MCVCLLWVYVFGYVSVGMLMYVSVSVWVSLHICVCGSAAAQTTTALIVHAASVVSPLCEHAYAAPAIFCGGVRGLDVTHVLRRAVATRWWSNFQEVRVCVFSLSRWHHGQDN